MTVPVRKFTVTHAKTPVRERVHAFEMHNFNTKYQVSTLTWLFRYYLNLLISLTSGFAMFSNTALRCTVG